MELDTIFGKEYNAVHLRESPSGKASAFQADIRGSESRLPLYQPEPPDHLWRFFA